MNRLKYMLVGFIIAIMMFVFIGATSSDCSRGNTKFNPIYVRVVK